MSKCEVVNSGLDWLTMTSTEGDLTDDLITIGNSWADTLQGMGHNPKKWRGMGYSGFSCGPLKYGIRNGTEGLIIFAGELSDWAIKRSTAWSFKPTRVDLQTTVRLSEPATALAQRLYDRLRDANSRSARKRYIKLLRSSTGDTLYIGRRNSAIMLRFYDKSLDSGEGELGRVWRYEVEYKKSAARTVYNKLTDKGWSAENTAGQVLAEFEKRGVTPLYQVTSSISAIEVKRVVADEKRRIEWLEKCVSPVVVQLCMAGFEDKVLEALSLKGIARKEQKLWH